jgi:hypothetical protein
MDGLKQCRMRILSDMKKAAYSDHHQTDKIRETLDFLVVIAVSFSDRI